MKRPHLLVLLLVAVSMSCAAFSASTDPAPTGDDGGVSVDANATDGNLAPSDASDAGPEVKTEDASSCAVDTAGGANVRCEVGTCGAGELCCVNASEGSTECMTSETACHPNELIWRCEGPAGCSGNSCCASLVFTDDTACPREVNAKSRSYCAQHCIGSDIVLCSPNTPCPTGASCTAIKVPLGVGSTIVGACL